MKKFLALFLVLLMALSLVACSKTEQEQEASANTKQELLTMGTGGPAGTYFAFGGVLANVLNEKIADKVNINVVTTGGSGDNLQNMAMGVYQLATVQSDVMTYAYEGSRSFAETGAVPNVRVLAGLYAETVQIVTTNPDIKTVADLKGKKVCVGDVNSGTYFNACDVFAAYDMDVENDIQAIYQSFGDSTESLKDGKIDAAFIVAGAPTTAVVDLGTAKKVYLVSIDDEHMDKLLAACPFYAKYVVGKDVYNTDEDCTTVTVKATLVADAALSDDVAYAIVSTIYGNIDEITAAHAKGAELDLTFATEGMAVPFHPGAAKFFAEQGITVESR
ncbi:MAG: TAXI family TRAP transporter solute-binding subunit [Clostridia bacterium]|nr:TAXI family TRAP transporter solute-binding subunit [Clostridia bacterium]